MFPLPHLPHYHKKEIPHLQKHHRLILRPRRNPLTHPRREILQLNPDNTGTRVRVEADNRMAAELRRRQREVEARREVRRDLRVALLVGRQGCQVRLRLRGERRHGWFVVLRSLRVRSGYSVTGG